MTPDEALTVIHVVRQFHPGIGGLENFVEQLAVHQLAAGHRVKVVTLDRIFEDRGSGRLPARETHLGIEVRRVRFVGSRRYPIAPGVLALIKDADIVHVHGVDFFCDYIAATAPLHGIPTVLTTHGGFFHTDYVRALKKVYFQTVTRGSLSQYGAVIACSEEDYRRFRAICASRLTLIPNPVDIEKFEALADANSSTMIYFGRIAPNKELERLVRWFAGAVGTNPKWRLIIAGKSMGTDASALARLAGDLGISEQVEIHEKPSDDDLRELISRSSVYCCASSYEGFGLAAVEGASAGLYPVLSDIPPFRHNLERLGFGMIVDFEDESTWLDSYRQLGAELESFRAKFDRLRIRRAVEPFAWAAAIDDFTNVYNRVLGRNKRRIGNVNVDVVDRARATEVILDAAEARRPLMVTFCNAHTANLAGRDRELQAALEDALVLNDGVGVDIASRLIFGARFPENLNGTDFTPQVLASARPGTKLFLLGGAAGVAEAAARNIRAQFPHVEVAGTMNGYFEDDQSDQIVTTIRNSGADLLLVGMGQPRQETWVARHIETLAMPAMCVGALLDFLAERVPRAPAAVRRLRFEWAFRLMSEPRRLWRRYLLGNATFLSRTLWQHIAGTRI